MGTSWVVTVFDSMDEHEVEHKRDPGNGEGGGKMCMIVLSILSATTSIVAVSCPMLMSSIVIFNVIWRSTELALNVQWCDLWKYILAFSLRADPYIFAFKPFAYIDQWCRDRPPPSPSPTVPSPHYHSHLTIQRARERYTDTNKCVQFAVFYGLRIECVALLKYYVKI